MSKTRIRLGHVLFSERDRKLGQVNVDQDPGSLDR